MQIHLSGNSIYSPGLNRRYNKEENFTVTDWIHESKWSKCWSDCTSYLTTGKYATKSLIIKIVTLKVLKSYRCVGYRGFHIFLDIRPSGCQPNTPTHLYLHEGSWYSFLLAAESTAGHIAAGRIRSNEKCYDLGEIRILDLTACGRVLHYNTLPHSPSLIILKKNIHNEHSLPTLIIKFKKT
jgi:hypothetical protein